MDLFSMSFPAPELQQQKTLQPLCLKDKCGYQSLTIYLAYCQACQKARINCKNIEEPSFGRVGDL
jgi:hypothetical protein